jgi:hypothetical protein
MRVEPSPFVEHRNTARARSSAPQVDDGADAFRVYC